MGLRVVYVACGSCGSFVRVACGSYRQGQPRLLSSADEFVRELMYGEHMDEIVVLRNGCELLQQQGAVPTPITGAIQGNKTVRAFLRDLGEETRRTHNARVYYLDESGRHTRQLRRDAGGKELKNLQEKLAELERREVSQDFQKC